MDDEEIYGKRAHTLTFGDAAKKGIICPYKVVITLIDKKQVDDFALKNGITLVEGESVKAKWVASQIAVSSAIKHTNATKIITFHSRVKTAREFASDEVYGVKKFVENFDIFHVHGKQKSNERKETISKFRKARRSIITNAKCLTEGVDVPAVDMVAFVDPRHSKIDIAQAVGRAMRKPRGGDKEVGYIVVPIFAEDTSEQSLEEAIKSEDFDGVALILNSLLEQDEELVEIIRELKQAKGLGESFNPKKLKDKVEVIGPIIGLDELTNSIYVEAIDRLGESWDEWYGRLVKFKKREKHCDVPITHIEDEFKLGGWVSNQRTRKELLTDYRLSQLNELGFVWDALDYRWDEGLICLLRFIERNGHCLVPATHNEGEFKLGSWVNKNRTTKNQLSDDRLHRLNKLGFIWDPFYIQWNEGFNSLIKFKELNGHCLVPAKCVNDNFNLGAWVNTQRTNKDDLSVDRLSQLNELGFIWDAREYQWNKGFNLLLKYIEREGHSRVQQNHIEDDFKLGFWVFNQRNNKEKLSAERINQLNAVELSWDFLEDQWDEGFSYLSKYKELNGHCLVPATYIVDEFRLGGWVRIQRAKKDQLSELRLLRLNKLGFIWGPREDQWNKGFSALEKFFHREGVGHVPQKHIEDGFKLGVWVSSQRQVFKDKKLSLEKIKKLQNLSGWSWDATDFAAHSISKKGVIPSKVSKSKL